MPYKLKSISNVLTVTLMGIALVVLAHSCKKYTDEPGKTDPRLVRKYCNDPEAVNYNRDFPGTEDNSVCYYPSDVYEGQYTFIDSIYSGNSVLIKQVPLVLDFSPLSKTNLRLSGFCGTGGQTISLTVNRSLKASIDTTITNGQPLCRPKDTVSGYMSIIEPDTMRMRIFMTVVSDTGVYYHRGTAIRQ